ncbi:S8 family serine peptidase [Azoarcus sp. PA01]|nr:S8 family serine peptidase [Azoarcus sp. PA01]
MKLRVGVVDGGFECVAPAALHAAAQFTGSESDGVVRCEMPHAAALPHGECVAALILAAAPAACLIDARVATLARPATPRLVAAAIDWCVAEGARVVNLSLGLADDRRVLRDACERAVAQGVVLVAAAPARGLPVYPARYPGVLAVSGDARCAPGQWSRLDAASASGAAWGTCPDAPGGAPGGASMAAARFAGLVANHLMQHPDAGLRGLGDHLAAFASWHGRENRRIAETDS